MIVAGDHVAKFVADGLGFSPCPPFTTMGVVNDGVLSGGIIFSGFIGTDVDVTVYGHGWTRSFLDAVGLYVYDQLGCERMTFVTESDEVATYAVRLGGKIEGVMRSHFGPSRDGIIVGVLQNEWRYSRLLKQLARLESSCASVTGRSANESPKAA